MASDLDEAALGQWLGQHVAGFAGPFSVAKFPGGQSNPTYRIDAASGGYVLRRKPFGILLPSAHAVDREYRLLAALHPTGFPVAQPHALCTDDGVIGSMFYVMALVEGRTIWDGAAPGLSPADRRATYEALTDTLAALHRIVPADIGLGDYGAPGNFFARQVGRWTKQYRASQTDDLPVMERLIEWLPASMPAQTGTTIVHGDYRIDNAILAPDAPHVLAVLDWELSTLGDPLADFSYFAMNWEMPHDGHAGLKGLDLNALGIPSLEEITERYAAAMGLASVPRLDWYFAYNLFRLAAIVQGIKKRMIDGNASSDKAAAMVARLPMLADGAWRFASAAGA